MEMRAIEDTDIGQDLTPPLRPLAFSLYNSSLLSHCSACFSLLSPPPNQFPPILPTFPSNPHHVPISPILYCSPQCSTSDSDLHLSTAEHHLLLLFDHGGDTSDLRAALRLLKNLRQNEGSERVGGLMSNREKLMSRENEELDGDISARIRDGAKAMAVARRMRDGLDLDFNGDCVLEEAVLCAVLTNAVEVQVNGERSVGIAVYNTDFSWINHSCSPNACYRFLPPAEAQFSGESRLLIRPAAADGGRQIEVTHKECSEYGPRIVVRSIRTIKKGEEVSIAYTDLLQPKGMRQAELWLKYQFVCCCSRCSEHPPAYPDHALQEISAVNLDYTNLSTDHNFDRDEAVKKFNDYIDDAINDYLSLSNPESCCAKLENMLIHGIHIEQSETKEEKPQKIFRMHPLNHLTLSTYTVLASAYKVRSSDLAALNPVKNEHQLEAFGFSITSAAYSFLLASATHRLFLFDSSLIASLSKFWTSAGESLLCLARSSVWNSFLKRRLSNSEFMAFRKYRCFNCMLMDKFEANFVGHNARNAEFEDISSHFLGCIRTITPKAWSFLVHKSCYLRFIKDPFDFGWLGTMESSKALDSKARLGSSDTERSFSKCEAQGYANQERISIFQLGVHCLLYGGFLSSICCDPQSYLTPCIKKLLYGEDNPIDNFAHRTN